MNNLFERPQLIAQAEAMNPAHNGKYRLPEWRRARIIRGVKDPKSQCAFYKNDIVLAGPSGEPGYVMVFSTQVKRDVKVPVTAVVWA